MSGKVEVEKELCYLNSSGIYLYFIDNPFNINALLGFVDEIDRYLALISKGVPPDATIQFFRHFEALPNQESVEKYYVIWEAT